MPFLADILFWKPWSGNDYSHQTVTI